MPAKTYRNFVFTSWHDLFAPVDFRPGSPLRKLFRHVCFALETSQEGHLHLQGYCATWHPCSRTAARQAIQSQWSTANVDDQKGSYVTNEWYCSKENYVQEFGLAPNATGVKNTLLTIKHRIDEGEPLYNIVDDDKLLGTYCQYRGGVNDYIRLKRQKIVLNDGFLKPELYFRIGRAGTGKSRWIFEQYGYDRVTTMYPARPGTFFVPPDTGDFVLFDDVKAGAIIPLTTFKYLTDGHPKLVECKGGQVMWRPKVVVFTSNFSPRTWWPEATEEDWEAIMRRVTEIVSCD